MTDAPFYADKYVTLYHGDCRDVSAWLDADVLVTDPPYGMAYSSRYNGAAVIGDESTALRDYVLAAWPAQKPAMCFGSWRNPRPRCDQVIVWDKGVEAALGHPIWFSAHEEVYVRGMGWVGPRGPNVVRLNGITRGGSLRKDIGHPTPKPVALMELLIRHAPHGASIADPFAGSGATLLAARNQGRRAIGIEIDERHCEVMAARLAQDVLDFGEASA